MSAYSDVITAAIGRLLWHSADQPGRILRGIKFEQIPIKETDGKLDLPQVRCFPNDLSETFVLRSALNPSVVMRVQAAASRDLGMANAVELLEKVMDALETDVDGSIDPIFGGTLDTPMSWKANGNMATDLTITMEASITFSPGTNPLRGQRRRIRYLCNGAGQPVIDGAGKPIAA